MTTGGKCVLKVNIGGRLLTSNAVKALLLIFVNWEAKHFNGAPDSSRMGGLVEASILIFGNWKSERPNGKATNSSEMGRSIKKNFFWLKYFSVHLPQR